METTVNNNTVNESWIKLGFYLWNDRFKRNEYLTTDGNNSDVDLRQFKNECVCSPAQWADEYGVSLYSWLKENYEGLTKASLKLWAKDEASVEACEKTFNDLKSVTGFKGNIVKIESKGPAGGYMVIQYAESEQSSHQAGSGAEQAKSIPALD